MRYRYHLNLAGGLYLGVTMLVGFASTVRPNNLLVWIFGFLLSLVVISGLTSGGASGGMWAALPPGMPQTWHFFSQTPVGMQAQL